MEPTLRLRFLGPLQVERDGEPVRGLRSRKALALLGYLAVLGQPIPREQLADLFWEDRSESRGRANLSWALNRISSVLTVCLQTDRHSVQFQRTGTCWLDIDAFEMLETQGDAASLTAAAELSRGEFLEGMYLDGCPEFELWLVAERERWRERVALVLEKLVVHHSRRGAYEQGLRFARRLLALEPWREGAHRQVMELLARSGQREAALAQYETCRQILAEELGVEPMVETTALYERILAVASARRQSLPAQPTPFVGRQEELAEMVGLLGDPGCRLLTVVGPGGIGKTRLALQAAAIRAEAFLEGVYFVPLVGVSSADFVVSAIADVLQFSLSGPQDPQGQLLGYLQGKELLLILDNLEHLLAGTELLGEILQQAPQVKLLVTSRERLNLRWEWCFEVGGLKYPESEPTAEQALANYDAVQLFQQTARRVNRHFSLASHDELSVMRICQLVEGMPLGIDLAASWVGTRTCTEIAQEIAHNLSFLATALRDVPERHQSMQATFEGSWYLLTLAEQRAFAALSVFRGGFSREAAGEVAGASSATLGSLVNKSLLRFLPSGRYEVHELLRQYAAEKLAARPQAQARVRDRHCVYFAAFLQSREDDLIGAGAVEALAAIKAEIENVRGAWRWAATQGRLEEIERGLNGLSNFYFLAGPLQEGDMAIGMAADHVRAILDKKTDETGQPGKEMQIILSKLLVEHTRFLMGRGVYDQAIAAAQAAVDLASSADENGHMTRLKALGYLRWGQVLLRQGAMDTARTQFELALTLARAASLLSVEANCLNSLGAVSYGQGDYVSARSCYEQALPIYRETGDRRGEGASLNNLGLISLGQGDYAVAKAYFEQTLHVHREIGDRQIEGTALQNLGRVFLQQSKYVGARTYLEQALRICRETGDRWGEGWVLVNLGRVALDQGSYADTKAYCERALYIFREIGARRGEGLALMNLGNVLCLQSDYAEAMGYLEQALHICREIGDRQGESWALTCQGEYFADQGDYTRARAILEQALDIYRESGDREGEGWGLVNLGLLLHHLGDDEVARKCSQEALSILQELGARSLQGTAWLHLGHALAGLGRSAEATKAYRQALALRQELDQPNLAVEPLAGLARTSLTQGDLPRAQTWVEEILAYLEMPSASTGVGHALDGTGEPFRVYLTCYRVLVVSQDPRAQEILSTAHRLLQERAARISDEDLRRSYLENVPAHREILNQVRTLHS